MVTAPSRISLQCVPEKAISGDPFVKTSIVVIVMNVIFEFLRGVLFSQLFLCDGLSVLCVALSLFQSIGGGVIVLACD